MQARFQTSLAFLFPRASNCLTTHHGPANGPGAHFSRYYRIDHGPRHYPFHPLDHGVVLASSRGLTEESVHVFRTAFVRTEMNGKNIDGSRTIPRGGDRNFPAGGNHSDVFRGKTQDPGLIFFFQPATTVTLKTNHYCPLKNTLMSQKRVLFAERG